MLAQGSIKKKADKTISFDADKLEMLKKKAKEMNVPTSSYIKMKLFGGLQNE